MQRKSFPSSSEPSWKDGVPRQSSLVADPHVGEMLGCVHNCILCTRGVSQWLRHATPPRLASAPGGHSDPWEVRTNLSQRMIHTSQEEDGNGAKTARRRAEAKAVTWASRPGRCVSLGRCERPDDGVQWGGRAARGMLARGEGRLPDGGGFGGRGCASLLPAIYCVATPYKVRRHGYRDAGFFFPWSLIRRKARGGCYIICWLVFFTWSSHLVRASILSWVSPDLLQQRLARISAVGSTRQ